MTSGELEDFLDGMLVMVPWEDYYTLHKVLERTEGLGFHHMEIKYLMMLTENLGGEPSVGLEESPGQQAHHMGTGLHRSVVLKLEGTLFHLQMGTVVLPVNIQEVLQHTLSHHCPGAVH